MAFEVPITGGDHSFKAAADLSAKQYYAVKLDSSGKIALCDTAGDQAFGILQDKPGAANRAGSVRRHGISKAVLAGTVAVLDKLTTDQNGKLVKGYGADRVVAIALEAGVAGDIVAVDVAALSGAFAQHGPHTKTFELDLASITAADVITAITPGYAGRLKKAYFVADKAVTTGSKAATLQPKITPNGGALTPTTGGAIALTSAALTPKGAVVAGSAITAANTFGASDTLSVVASAVTAFAEGTGNLVLEFA